MHDLHAADHILQHVIEEAEKNKLKKVTNITVELGRVIEHGEEINASNLKFLLKNLADKTIAAGAKIEIKTVPGPTWKLVSINEE